MKIERIGELRSLIASHDGELKIGKLTISHKENEDIDFNFDGHLIQWIDESVGDAVKFIGEDYFSVSSDFEEGEKAKEEVRKVKKELEAEQKKNAESSLAEGKVAAYEKMLIGRTVTLGQ